MACHHSGSECILVASRRGGPFRQQHQPGKRIPRPSVSSPFEVGDSEYEMTGLEPFRPGDDRDQQASDGGVPMELRNPSDALQILARSGDTNSAEPLNHRASPFNSQHSVSHNHTQEAGSNLERLSRGAPRTGYASSEGRNQSTNKVLEEYELIKTGSLHPKLLPELLRM